MIILESWRVTNSTAAAMSRHRDRFLGSCLRYADPDVSGRRAGSLAARLASDWAEAVESVPAAGDWFPKIEFDTASGEIRTALRPAPIRPATVSVRVAASPDARAHPGVKGPDLAYLAAVRADAAQHGCEEAILADQGGYVVEGAYSSIVWWEGDRLTVVHAATPRLPGITESRLLSACRRLGIPCAQGRLASSALADHEVWALNSVDTIRTVRVGGVAGGADGAQPPESPRARDLTRILRADWVSGGTDGPHV